MIFLGALIKGPPCDVVSSILSVPVVWLDSRTWGLEQGPQALLTAGEKERGHPQEVCWRDPMKPISLR